MEKNRLATIPNQYTGIYQDRLARLGPRSVSAALAAGWACADRLDPIVQSEKAARRPAWAIGTLVLRRPGTRSNAILEHGAGGLVQDAGRAVGEKERDTIQDESGFLTILLGDDIRSRVVTGIVVGVRGTLDTDKGVLEVEDIVFPGQGAAQADPSHLAASPWCAGIESPSQDRPGVLFCTSLSILEQKAKLLCQPQTSVYVVPCKGAPTHLSMPREPIPRFMLGGEAMRRLVPAPCPWVCDIDGGHQALACDSLGLDDVMAQLGCSANDALCHLLLWAHAAPGAPDTVPCIPVDKDPFVIDPSVTTLVVHMPVSAEDQERVVDVGPIGPRWGKLVFSR